MNKHDAFTKVAEWGECARENYGSAFIQDNMREQDVIVLAKVCNVCAVKRTCFDLVNPRESYFSGMCAGVGWNDGNPVGTARHTPAEQIDLAVAELLLTITDEA